MAEKLTVAVVGATGAVGREIIHILEQREFPVKTLVPLEMQKQQKRSVRFAKKDISVKELSDSAFNGVDLTFFAAGGTASKEFAWEAVRRGSLVVDNGSTFRMRPDVPLIIPEVNLKHIRRHRGLISNPNPSTIQMCVALKPISEKLGLKRIVVSTYQSVSSAGREAVDELQQQLKALLSGKKYAPKVLSKQIAFNCIPQTDTVLADLSTREESMIIEETRKIFSDPGLPISATCVLVPVLQATGESVNVEAKKKLTLDAVRKMLKKSPGIVMMDDEDPAPGDELRRTYPLHVDVAGKDGVFVGRLRKDLSVESGFDMWIVADNLRKGSALNAIQIAEFLF